MSKKSSKYQGRGFPGGPVVKTLPFQCRGHGLNDQETKIPHAMWYGQLKKKNFKGAAIHGELALGNLLSPGEGNGNPLQYSCLENSMDGGTWWATVPGVTKSRT